MAVFEYKATESDSSVVDGTIVADTARAARDLLRERGFTVNLIRPSSQAKQAGQGITRQKDQAQVISFIRELATLLRTGIPLLGALSTLSAQHRGRFRSGIQHLCDQVAAGVSLAGAMRDLPCYFDEFCVSIVQVGENTGSLDVALKRLAEFREKTNRLRSRVTTALVYPLFVCVIGLCVSMFLMTYVVPLILSTLNQAGRQLPAITRMVKTASDLMVGWWWLILIVIAAIILLVKAVLKTDRGRWLFSKGLLKVPVIGELVRKENTSRIAVVLAALLRSGLQFIDAVQITRGTLKNRVFSKAMEQYQSAVAAGKDVSEPLKATGVFAPMVVQMLAVGQQTGNLEEMLEQLAETYDQEVNTATARMTAMIEPLLIVLLAILVGFIAFATILPILEMSNVL